MARKQKTYWAGFCDGRPDFDFDEKYPRYGRLYKRKKDALYQDVRKVKIVEVKPTKRRSDR
jgi:hypothetical protein